MSHTCGDWKWYRALEPLAALCNEFHNLFQISTSKLPFKPSAILMQELPSNAWVFTTFLTLSESTHLRIVSTSSWFFFSMAYIKGVFPLFLSCKNKFVIFNYIINSSFSVQPFINTHNNNITGLEKCIYLSLLMLDL